MVSRGGVGDIIFLQNAFSRDKHSLKDLVWMYQNSVVGNGKQLPQFKLPPTEELPISRKNLQLCLKTLNSINPALVYCIAGLWHKLQSFHPLVFHVLIIIKLYLCITFYFRFLRGDCDFGCFLPISPKLFRKL